MMKKRITMFLLCAMLLTGCSNQNNTAPNTETSTTAVSTAENTTAVSTAEKTSITSSAASAAVQNSALPTKTLDRVENVTITVPDYPDCPLDALKFFDCRREIEGIDNQQYIRMILSPDDEELNAAENMVITELPNQNGVRAWKIRFRQGNAQKIYVAEKHHIYYFMDWRSDSEQHMDDVMSGMQIDDSKLNYAYDPDNDTSDDTQYCYSQLTAEEQKIYNEIYQLLNPLTIPEHNTWTRSNVTEAEAQRLRKIVQGINLDYDEEFFFHNREVTYENGVFTVYSELMVTSVPAEQLIPENLKAYQNIVKKTDEIIAAMPKTLTRYGKYLYLAKAVCDMIQYDASMEPYYLGRIRGAFEEGRTMCQGYGDTFEMLCHRAGLYCLCISGNGHKWNGIRLNNEMYHFDTTWMDGDEWGYYETYAHPFTSDEEGHAPHMSEFGAWTQMYPEWEEMVLNTGSIDWEKELTAPMLK